MSKTALNIQFESNSQPKLSISTIIPNMSKTALNIQFESNSQHYESNANTNAHVKDRTKYTI